MQTPTLAIIEKREEEIRNFKPKEYYSVTLTAENVQWTWREEKSKSFSTFKKEKAEKVLEDVTGEGLHITSVETKAKKSYSPGLYDLTTLQREANQKFGFSAKETLNIMQRLYENHKVLTYPRTDFQIYWKRYSPTIKERLRACGTGPL